MSVDNFSSGKKKAQAERERSLERALQESSQYDSSERGERVRSPTTLSIEVAAPTSGSLVVSGLDLSSIEARAHSSDLVPAGKSKAQKESIQTSDSESSPAFQVGRANAVADISEAEAARDGDQAELSRPGSNEELLRRLAMRAEKGRPVRVRRARRRLAVRFGIGVVVGVAATFLVIFLSDQGSKGRTLLANKSPVEVITVGKFGVSDTALVGSPLVDLVEDKLLVSGDSSSRQLAADSAFSALAVAASEWERPLSPAELVMSREKLRLGAPAVLVGANVIPSRSSKLVGIKHQDRYARPGVAVDYQGGFILNDPQGNLARGEGYEKYLKEQYGDTLPRLEALSPEGSKLIK